MEEIRCYVAVELSESVRETLFRLREGIEARMAAAGLSSIARWVEPSGVHLTLKFLGNVAPGAVPEVQAYLQKTLARQPRFRLQLAGMAVFPSPRAPRVVWVGLTGDVEGLVSAQQRVEEALEPLGFPTENRAFTPHLTLARVREEASPSERQALGDIVIATPPPQPVEVAATEISLMRSELRPVGPRYTRLFAVPLV